MELSNDSNMHRDYLRRAVNSAVFLSSELDRTGATLPVISAMIHVIKHAAKGGTIDNFKPLLRTLDYAGIDR